MYLLTWIVIGAVVGWGAGKIFQGNGYGPLMDVLMGAGGAVVGGFTMSLLGVGGYGGSIEQLLGFVRELHAECVGHVAAGRLHGVGGLGPFIEGGLLWYEASLWEGGPLGWCC